MTNQLLFCYGTLLSGFGNNRLLQKPGVEFLGEHTTEPGYTMVSCGGFPAVIPEGHTSIKGELYRVTDEEVLHNVYSLEGYTGTRGDRRNWYDGQILPTPFGDALMFIFHNNLNNRPIIKSGDFKNQ